MKRKKNPKSKKKKNPTKNIKNKTKAKQQKINKNLTKQNRKGNVLQFGSRHDTCTSVEV